MSATTLSPSPSGTATPQSQPPKTSTLVAGLKQSLALAERSLIKTYRTPEALIDVTIQPIIMLAMFVYIFGGAISGGHSQQYLQYILPGMVGMSIAMAGIAIGQNLNADIEKGVFDRFRSLPILRSAPLIGIVLADFVRYLVLFIITLGFGMVMGFQLQTGWLAALAALGISIAFGLCFSWVSVWVGMKVRTSGAVQGIMMLIVMPLSFASSTFVPPETMPGGLQAFVKINPITHLVDTVRGLMIGGDVAMPLLWTLVTMACMLVIFVPLALRAYNRKA